MRSTSKKQHSRRNARGEASDRIRISWIDRPISRSRKRRSWYKSIKFSLSLSACKFAISWLVH
jgi:hypothetical protein